MRIGPEHIEKKIKTKLGTVATVLAVDGDTIRVKLKNGRHATWYSEHPLYEIIEPEKLPSERILERMGNPSGCTPIGLPLLCRFYHAVLHTLDEDFLRRKK